MADSQAGIDRIFHALGDPTRRAMLEMLSAKPHSVSGLATPLNITLTAVGQHLQILEDCGLVKTAKVGRVRTCELVPAGFAALEKWIQNCRTIWERRFDRLGELLKEEDE